MFQFNWETTVIFINDIIPTTEFFVVDGLHCLSACCERKIFDLLAVVAIASGNLNSFKTVHYVRLHHHQICSTVKHDGVFQCWQIKPAAAAWTTCGCTKFMSVILERLINFIEQFSWEWAGAYAGTVCLKDTVYFADAIWSNAQPWTDSSSDDTWWSDKWIAAKVYIEHRTLGTFG